MTSWLGRLSPRRRNFVISLTTVLAVVLAVVVVAVWAAGDNSPASGAPGFPAQDRPGPVLLVPGYGGNRASLLVLARQIRSTGRQATVLHLPGNGTGSLVTDA